MLFHAEVLSPYNSKFIFKSVLSSEAFSQFSTKQIISEKLDSI